MANQSREPAPTRPVRRSVASYSLRAPGPPAPDQGCTRCSPARPGAAATCSGYGIVDGDGNGAFLPGDDVLRGEASKFVSNFLRVATGVERETPSPSVFFDVEVLGLFGPFILQLEELGIVGGVEPGIFAPARSLTRGEMAVIVHDALVQLGVEMPVAAPTFPDTSTTGAPPKCLEKLSTSIVAEVMISFRSGRRGSRFFR